ncbi:hypothetical protein D3C73_1132030 [compost metagenome]
MLGEFLLFTLIGSAERGYSIIFTDVNQLNPLSITSHGRNTIHAGTDQGAARCNDHEVLVFFDNLQPNYRTILVGKVDGLDPFTATCLRTIVQSRGTFAITLGGYNQYLQLLVYTIHPNNMVIGIKCNTFNAGCAASHRTDIVL